MTTEYSGGGDAARRLELLWGVAKSPTRGPKPGLTVERIVQAAIELADSEGITALSMRRVAERIGVGAMSLYTYIPSKAELLDIMLDTVFGELLLPTNAAGDWRTRLEARAQADWALYGRHPWVLQVSGARALLGPNELALFEATLAAVADLGLTGTEMVSAITLVGGYVRGAAQGAQDAALAAQRTGMTDTQWWEANGPLLAKYYDPARYPIATRISQEGAFEPQGDSLDYNHQRALNDFAFGLQRVLDGLASFIERRTAEQEQETDSSRCSE